MSFWSGVRQRLKTPLARVGLGSAALMTLAVGLWPDPGSQFDPEKAAAFVTASALWLYAELFADEGAISAHDQELANRICTVMRDKDVRFLKEHDFGGTWLKRDLDPVYELAHFAGDVNSEFVSPVLQRRFKALGGTVRQFADMMAMGAGPLGVGPSPATQPFSMIPEMERAAGEWSARTTKRVAEANELATELSSQISQFYRLLRNKGANLLGNSR